MYAKRIIPCLDVKNGRVVKGMSFVDLVDAGNPVECAKQYDKQGADELVFLDITASSDGRATTVDMVKEIANTIFKYKVLCMFSALIFIYSPYFSFAQVM